MKLLILLLLIWTSAAGQEEGSVPIILEAMCDSTPIPTTVQRELIADPPPCSLGKHIGPWTDNCSLWNGKDYVYPVAQITLKQVTSGKSSPPVLMIQS